MSGAIVEVARVTETQLHEMWLVFARYYDHISFERFASDLSHKDYVILLFDRAGTVQGFSTMQHLSVERDGVVHRGLFSGDTVVAEAYWGQRVLGKLFLRHLFVQKLKHPLQPFWWFLISKGYKTYLLMANNFSEYYPSAFADTPAEAQAVLDAFATELFPDAYDAATGLIEFPESLGQLRRGIAPITTELLAHPKVAFFQRVNPTWARGTELACIARMTWGMPVYYSVKALARTGRRWSRRRLATQAGQP